MTHTDDDRLFESLRAAVRSAPDPAPLPAAGDEVGGRTIVREVHRGGQGVVYEARDDEGTRVAVKVMLRESSAGWDPRRHERELDLSRRLDHPALVTPVDHGHHEGRDLFVLPWVDGTRLDRWARGRDGDEIVDLFLRLCDGVKHAHERGVIHRDLKPGNVLVDVVDEPHLLDFGIARPLLDSASEMSRITATGEFLGTLGYAAPEQLSHRSEDAGVETDVYSLGAMLYELLLGRPPFAVDGKLAPTIERILRDPPSDPSQGARTVDRRMRAILLRCLAKRPSNRYASVSALMDDLTAWLDGRPVAATRGLSRIRSADWVTSRAARWRWPFVAACLIVLAWGMHRWWTGAEPRAEFYLEEMLSLHAADEPESDVRLLELLGQLADEKHGDDPIAEARLHRQLAERCLALVLRSRAFSHLRRAEELLEPVSGPTDVELTDVRLRLADVLVEARRPGVSEVLDSAERRSRAAGDPVRLARALVLKARAVRFSLIPPPRQGAQAWVDEALSLTESPRRGSRAVRGVALHESAMSAWRRGEVEGAVRDLFDDARALLRDAGAAGADRAECELDRAHHLEVIGARRDCAAGRRDALDQLRMMSTAEGYSHRVEVTARGRVAVGDPRAAIALMRARVADALRACAADDDPLAARAHAAADGVEHDEDVISGLRVLLEAWGAGAYEITRIVAILADAHRDLGDVEAVRRLVEWEGRQIDCRSYGADCPYRIEALEVLARCCADAGAEEEARAVLERSIAIRRRQGWLAKEDGPDRLMLLAEVSASVGREEDARRLLEELAALFEGELPRPLAARSEALRSVLGAR